jgi:hypothetical protein
MFIALCAMGALAFDGSLKKHSAAAPTSSANSKWLDDMRAAHNLAKDQGKDILIRVIRPAAPTDSAKDLATSAVAVLDSEAFVRPASATFVLLQLAVEPDARSKSAAANQTGNTGIASGRSQNKVAEFFLLDPDGNGYAKSDIFSKDPAAYRHEFERLHHLRICRGWEREWVQTSTGIKLSHHLTGLVAAVGSLAETGFPDLRPRADEPRKRGVRFDVRRIVVPDKRNRAVKL